MKNSARIILTIALLIAASCTNLSDRTSSNRNSGNPAILFTGSGTVSYTHVLKNIVPSSPPGDTSTELALSVDAGTPGFAALTGFCSVGGSLPCSCQMNWKQSDIGIDRQRRLAVTQVQAGLVRCAIPRADWDSIAMGTVITMSIVPGTANGSVLSVKPLAYKKGTVLTTAGDFLDSTLTPFRNIHRYTCHSKRTAPHEILNKYLTMSDSSGNSIKIMLSSCFCTGTTNASAGSAGGSSGGIGASCEQAICPSNVRQGYSAQNYYRNFYIQSDKVGLINQSNDTYDCPRVLESIKTYATSVGVGGVSQVPASERGKYYPLDSSFALSTTHSSEWSVGVRAASVLLKPGDPNTNPSNQETCTGASVGFIENGVFPKCLGYAKKPKADGTCGTIQDSNGKIRPLVRLRRYRAMLPARFSGNGDIEGSGNAQSPIYPAVDEVYVADRLVIDSSGLATGDLIYGPKPCNYAWFDHEGTVTRTMAFVNFHSNLNRLRTITTPINDIAIPKYVATSKFYKGGGSGSTVAWTSALSVNPDGLIFPNEDYQGLGVGSLDNSSCSANLPRVSYTAGSPSLISIFTSYREATAAPIYFTSSTMNAHSVDPQEIHLRPVDPWSPQYLEDTAFEACVPLADPYLDPPLHFYRDGSSNYAWCAEVYPNQNPNWQELNKLRRPKASGNSYDTTLANWNSGTGSAPIAWFNLHQDTLGPGLCTNGTGRDTICDLSEPGTLNLACKTYLGSLGSRPNSCDRTAMFDPSQSYKDFPLLASEGDVGDMLMKDLSAKKNYACTYSVSSDPNKVNKQYPSSGCCGKKGGVAVLQALGGTSGGHLEPYLDSSIPDIRYCGHPVK
jgi:hypothetical protein